MVKGFSSSPSFDNALASYDSPSQPMRYLFLHVPKTAGSMFRDIVNRNFGAEAVVENPLMSEQVYSTSQIETMFEHYPYRFFMGHVFRLEPSLAALGGSIQLISFIRDPIAKARSAYQYLAGRELTRSDHPVKNKTFSEMCQLVLDTGISSSLLLDSSQLDWLVGRSGARLDDVVSSVQSRQLLLFPTEEFDLACLLLERLFNNDFKDCSYGVRVNVSQSINRLSHEKDRAAAEALPWIAADRELHQLAKSNINALAEQTLGGLSDRSLALDDFLKRCSAKTTPNPPQSRMRRLLSKLQSKL